MKNKILLLIVFMFLFIDPVSGAGEWKEYKRPHFIVYYKEAPEDFAVRVEEMAEYYYKKIAENLGFTRYEGWSWDNRAKIYIYDNADDYVNAGKQFKWSHGTASPKDRTIRTFPAAHGFFDSTLPHELGHIIFREFVGFKAEVPTWFEEGIAMYQEQAQRWGAHDTVRQALKEGTFIPLDQMTYVRLSAKMKPERVRLFYAESASAINYMINELGEERFVRFCRQLKKGNPFEWTLKSVYIRFKNTKELNTAWVKFLEK